jgi:phosphate transport system permease protein
MNNSRLNNIKDNLFQYIGILCTVFGLVVLGIFIGDIVKEGFHRLSWSFISSLPSRIPEKAGIYTALMGTVWILISTAIIAIPLGVSAGLYLEEYGSKNRFARFIEVNIANLAGVPSIIYGLLGLQIFVRFFNLGESILAGSMTLALLILPIVIVATREAIKAVPGSIP